MYQTVGHMYNPTACDSTGSICLVNLLCPVSRVAGYNRRLHHLRFSYYKYRVVHVCVIDDDIR